MAGYRKEKIEEQIKRIIGDVLLKEINDPRIGFVTVFKVELSKDYSHADIHVSVIGNDKQKKDALFGLRSATGFIRLHVGNALELRHVPELRFKIDESIENSMDIVNLIESANAPKKDVEEDDKGE